MNAVPLLKVQHEFDHDGDRFVIASLSIQAPSDAIFDALLDGYRDWCAASVSPLSTFQVFIHARSKDRAQEEVLQYLVDSWNSTEKPTCSGRVDVWVGSNAQSWYGFTNGPYPDDPRRRTQTVRYVTYEEMEAALSESIRESEAQERQRRRANPVRKPIKLPKTIAGQLAKYLKLEFPALGKV